jgi:hypothetical protein
MKQRNINIQEIKKYLDENPQIKTAVYIGIGVVVFYAAGRMLSALASSVKGFNEFYSAFKGD